MNREQIINQYISVYEGHAMEKEELEIMLNGFADDIVNNLQPSLPDNLPEEPVSDDLKGAAEEYADYNSRRWQEDGDIYYDHSKIKDAFKAGAEWQSKRDQETIETAEDHAFLAGSNWQKEQMMKDAVGGEVCGRVYDHVNVRFPDELCKYLVPKNIAHIPADVTKYKVGDKVRVIIVKEEEQ